MKLNHSHPSWKAHRSSSRRGNTIVLVTGILVLLVIIATAYVTRTQAGRTSSNSTLKKQLQDDKAGVVAHSIADQLALALFVSPMSQNNTVIANAQPTVLNSNAVHYPPAVDAVRYGRDVNFPYNFAPYYVIPFTNWPDGVNDPKWPAGPGNLGAAAGTYSVLLQGEGNPLGNPGFGDFRPLRDLEPQRWCTQDPNHPPPVMGPDAYSHWRHMSYIARPDNAFRLCTDISDIGDFNNDGYGRLLTDMSVPVEQWLCAPPSNRNPITGGCSVKSNFMALWRRWFGLDQPNNPLGEYQSQYVFLPPLLVNGIPANLYNLRDLDSDFTYGEPGERMNDDFTGPGVNPAYPTGTPRWTVGRVLADADGDGLTDSFWFLAPTTIDNGIRQIVAVSIIDNCSMLPINCATRFMRNDSFLPANVSKKTSGMGPCDLAFVGELNTAVNANGRGLSSNWNVGLYDNPDNSTYPQLWPGIAPDIKLSHMFAYQLSQWSQHLQEVGLAVPGAGVAFPTAGQRFDYWRRSASSPLSADQGSPYSPFGLEDELELRMYAGLNVPWIFSRYEHSVQDSQAGPATGFLRAAVFMEENNELREQRYNREMVSDMRHRVTTYSNARNDLMPPWLWKEYNVPERKLDLRSADLTFEGDVNELDGYRLREVLDHCLVDPQANLPGLPRSYYGLSTGAANKSHELASSFAADILARRDADNVAPYTINPAPIAESIPVTVYTGNATPNARYLGLEPQPFLVEAYIGHIYRAILVPSAPDPNAQDPQGDPYTNGGHNVVVEDPARYSVVIAVQIANPFNKPVDLSNFELNVFGQKVTLAGILQPATDEVPTTAIFYAIKPGSLPDDPSPPTLQQRWMDFLDIDPANLTAASIVTNVATLVGPGSTPWNVDDRNIYDDFSGEAITLARLDISGTAPASVVIDRFDPPGATDRKFGLAVNEMKNNKPLTILPPGQYDVPPLGGGPYGGNQSPPAADIGPDSEFWTHWVQWVRVTRAWGADVNHNGQYNDNERNPRFVFGDRAIVKPAGVSAPIGTLIAGGNKYKYVQPPDGAPGALPPTEPWFLREYHDATGLLIQRKPTFFDMNSGLGTVANYPDKGWYSQPKTIAGNGQAITVGDVDLSPVNNMRLTFPMQMLQKDNDFEQVGELLNVWLYGHKIDTVALPPAPVTYVKTLQTFSEFMNNDRNNIALVGNDAGVNRLRTMPIDIPLPSINAHLGQIVGKAGTGHINQEPRHGTPALPAGMRLLDAFVCDGMGLQPVDLNGDGVINSLDAYDLAKGYDGTGTPGLINIGGGAPPEVLRTLPHFCRLVHETGTGPAPTNAPLYDTAGQPLVTNGLDPAAMLPRSMLPEAIKQYCERYNSAALTQTNPTGFPGGTNYESRRYIDGGVGNMRSDRGMASPAEILALRIPASKVLTRPTADPAVNDQIYKQYWRIDMGVTAGDPADPAPDKPFWDGPGPGANQVSMRLSTDRDDVYNPANPAQPIPDNTAGDIEEANMLYAGASNMITTRSDTFTVYFRVRSFRQNTSQFPPMWDATNADYIVDDSRYVMLVDRSMVNHPGDKPKILYLEKLPN